MEPRLSGDNAIEIGDGKRPQEEKLEPDKADEEVGLLRDQVIAILAAVPDVEVDEIIGVEVLREATLGVKEWSYHNYEQEEE
ncbi:unnamed protein product [Ilex paraguariensis]|uniref:Uncharacterized protein n=1 Tax=Ilex paraguariensis TaxID=185542 RepID=A0ABC8TGE4_9AQUA